MFYNKKGIEDLLNLSIALKYERIWKSSSIKLYGA